MIPLLDLKPQYEAIGPDIEAAALSVLRSGNYVGGAPVAEFEDGFARSCGVGHAVGVSSGTSAIHLALRAAGIGPGDEVITVSATFVATVAAIAMTGATPVFVDIDPVTWTMDARLLHAALTPRTRAIVPVHLHGRLADMDAINAFAGEHGLLVVEDAAQAHAAERDGRRVGSFGKLACFSFYPGKNLGACGEGGIVTTDDGELAARLRRLRDWGQASKYQHVEPGFNERLHTLQAAILQVKLPHLAAWTEMRRDNAAQYQKRLSGAPGIICPAPEPGQAHAWHVFAVRVSDRDGVRSRMEAGGISTGIHYPVPVHLQPGWSAVHAGARALPETERLSREALSLPLWPEMGLEVVDRVADELRNCCEVEHERAA